MPRGPKPGSKGVSHYSEAEKKAALDLAARVGIRAACRELGIGSTRTVARWREEFPEYWSELVAGGHVAPARRRRTAESLEDLAEQYTEREFEALERAEKLIKTADAKELAALMKAMGASRGVATAGARGYRGEDAQVVEHNINFEALERAASAILERAPAPPPLPTPNLAEIER